MLPVGNVLQEIRPCGVAEVFVRQIETRELDHQRGTTAMPRTPAECRLFAEVHAIELPLLLIAEQRQLSAHRHQPRTAGNGGRQAFKRQFQRFCFQCRHLSLQIGLLIFQGGQRIVIAGIFTFRHRQHVIWTQHVIDHSQKFRCQTRCLPVEFARFWPVIFNHQHTFCRSTDKVRQVLPRQILLVVVLQTAGIIFHWPQHPALPLLFKPAGRTLHGMRHQPVRIILIQRPHRVGGKIIAFRRQALTQHVKTAVE
ncbi:hypothetical protein SRABI106_03440 [Rahnella aquatilis]|nr:hypothetical protein SRABI106_03440 [Rahnella aquatilis]